MFQPESVGGHRVVLLAACLAWTLGAPASGQPAPKLSPQALAEVDLLVEALASPDAGERGAAREKLLSLKQPLEGLLEAIPEPDTRMPATLRGEVEGVRSELGRRLALSAVGATRVTLSAKDQPLADALAAIESQTGNKLRDFRERFGQDATAKRVTLELDDAPFWEGLDRLLDAAALDVYEYAGEDALALVERDPESAPRAGAADYVGPFRVAASSVQAKRNLRRRGPGSLTVELEVGWEPRLKPIAVALPMSEIEATSDAGVRLSVAQPEQSVDVEVSEGDQVARLTLPFTPASRATKRIRTLRGTLYAIVPGRQAEFRFADLGERRAAAPQTQTQGGVTVSLKDVRKNGEIWELHMEMRLEDAGDSLASHRGWAFQNVSYLTGADGEPIEHAGFETTMQTPDTLGLAYLFDLPDGPKGLTWVYKSPAAIARVPLEFTLRDLPLP